MSRFLLALLLMTISHTVMAWENHALLTKIVLNDWKKKDASVSRYLNHQIQPESLKSFLNATQSTLPAKMLEIETWARNNESGYKFLPDNLFYQPSHPDCVKDLESCFKKSIRINLDVPLQPIVYDGSGYYSQQRGFTAIKDLNKIMPDYVANSFKMINFAFIPENTKVKVADIIATASIQPDFGFDVFLYEDSQTSFGKIYGFGSQPLGNPELPYNSQVLFHMSSYQEDPKITVFLPRLKEDYPEYRAFLYLSLSRFAEENNHPYWAALFLGWGLHYIQDLTQPYHSKIAYGLNSSLVLNAFLEAGKKNFIPFLDLENIQINRHIIIENLTNTILTSSEDGYYKKIIAQGLAESELDSKIPICNINNLYLRSQVSAHAIPAFEKILQATIPSEYINDPAFHVNTTMDLNPLFLHEMNKSQKIRFTESVSDALRWYGAYTRSCIQVASELL